MIDLNSDNDPLLFRVEIPTGALILQWTEVLAAIGTKADQQPGIEEVAAAIRKMARTPEVAADAPDAVLFAVFVRIAKAVEAQGN